MEGRLPRPAHGPGELGSQCHGSGRRCCAVLSLWQRALDPSPRAAGRGGHGAGPRAEAGCADRGRSGPAARRTSAASAWRGLGGPRGAASGRRRVCAGLAGGGVCRAGRGLGLGDPTAGCRGGGMRGGAAGVRPGPGSPRWGRGAERPPAGAAQPLLRPGSVGTGGGRGSLSSPLSWAQRVVLGGVPCEGAGEGPWAPESVRSARRGVWGTRGGTGQLEQAGPARVPGRGPGRVGEGWSAALASGGRARAPSVARVGWGQAGHPQPSPGV